MMKPVQVLLVDDDVDILHIGKEFLQDDGSIAVETATSAEDALKRMAVQQFDVIVCDYRMPPGMDSIGLLHAMKAQGITTPLIVFSGYTREDNAIDAIKNGAAFYLQKSSLLEVQYAEMKNMIFHLHRQRSAENALLDAQKELEMFSYSVSHDLRAPLRIIDGYCKILSDKLGTAVPPEAQQHISRLRAATLRMDAYFEDLLILSRSGRAPIKIEQVNLSSLVISVLKELPRPKEAPPIVQEIEKDVMVQGDRALLERVMQQLLENACKFSKNNNEVRITFGKKQEDGRPVYFVRDNGAGFDAAHAQDLCVPFHRFHPESQFSGTGIGLAIVLKIIQRLEGALWIDSAIGGGTTVYFTLYDGGIGPPGRSP